MSIIVNYMSTISLSGLIDNLASAYRSLARRVFPDVCKAGSFVGTGCGGLELE
jgi:spore maturation protein SpmA